MTTPSTDEIQHVRYRLQSIGDTEAKLSSAKITAFWEEVVEEVETFSGVSYNSGNALHRGCVCDGVAVMCIGDFIMRVFTAESIQLGEFRLEQQGLNWNVGVFDAAKDQYNTRYERRLDAISTKKYSMTNLGSGRDSASSTIGTALDIIIIGV